jgi:hypothetical protein
LCRELGINIWLTEDVFIVNSVPVGTGCGRISGSGMPEIFQGEEITGVCVAVVDGNPFG